MEPLRILVSNERLPGYRSTSVWEGLYEIYDPQGDFIGRIKDTSRRVPNGTEYGFVPDLPGRWALSGKVDAIKKLIERQASR